MLILPIHTRVIRPSDDLVSALVKAIKMYQTSAPFTKPTSPRLRGPRAMAGKQGYEGQADLRSQDIVVISSKAVAMSEGRIVDLKTLTISGEAAKLSKQCGRSPGFCQAVLNEMQFRNGEVRGTCPGAILTELRPHGLTQGTIFIASAGMDESNVDKGYAVGWPEDPVASVRRLRKSLNSSASSRSGPEGPSGPRTAESSESSPPVAVILSDSCCLPRRKGVTAFALAVSGIDPIRNDIGVKDLFGKPLRITSEAIADQLATAANFLMGNAAQSTPAVIIRDHGLPLNTFEGWVPGIEPEEDLFRKLL